MKNLLIATLTLISLNSFALTAEAPRYYQPEFTITDISPLCPTPKPGQVSCMAMGTKVTISANLGCLDKLVFQEITQVAIHGGLELHVASLAKADSASARAMCFRANTVTKTIIVQNGGGLVSIINTVIENQ